MIISVSGLPRSGTAFVSTLLNMNEFCIAYHELAAYRRDYKEVIKNTPAQYVADCTTYGCLPQAEVFPDKKVWIKNNVNQSKSSSEMACQKEVPINLLKTIELLLEQWGINALQIDREDVFTLEGCRRIWEYCFSEPFPELKVEQLIKLNIQHHEPHIHFGEGVELIL